jgi:C4-dicarboxylate-specific signal transduction histidine kinase
LKQLRNQLQQRVEQQTAELTAVNEQLRREMSERKEAGDDLKQLREQLEQCVEEISSEVAAANEQIQRATMERRRAGAESDEDADEDGAADEEIELLNPDKLKTLSELAKRLQ